MINLFVEHRSPELLVKQMEGAFDGCKIETDGTMMTQRMLIEEEAAGLPVVFYQEIAESCFEEILDVEVNTLSTEHRGQDTVL